MKFVAFDRVSIYIEMLVSPYSKMCVSLVERKLLK